MLSGVAAVAGCGATPPVQSTPARPGLAPGPAARAPLSFAPNDGRLDRRVRFVARADGASLFFTDRGVTLAFSEPGGDRGLALRLRFAGAASGARLEAGAADGGALNSLVGDRTHWRRGLPTRRALIYRGLWPGIDLVFRGSAGTLKYEFHVAAGADAGDIALAYDGARALTQGRDGSLSIHTALGVLTDARPVSYQRRGGERVTIHSQYARRGRGAAYGFSLGKAYDPTLPLVIDPAIAYSTFLGGTNADEGTAIAVDAQGNAYITGRTLSIDYPTTTGVTHGGGYGTDVFVTKLDASGAGIAYSTLIGGADIDEGLALAVAGDGSTYITGQTWSADYPTTDERPGPVAGAGDAFVTRLSADGSALSYSTKLAGSGRDTGLGIALSRGAAYVTGYTASPDFPTANAFDPSFNGATDTFVAKIDPARGGLVSSTFVGGSGGDAGFGIAVDSEGAAYITGRTSSPDYPTSARAWDPILGGGSDAVVTKLAGGAVTLVYSTLLGGGGLDGGAGIAVDEDGIAYVTGFTGSTDYPATPESADASFNGVTDAFVTALRADGSAPEYSTFLGGSGRDEGAAIALDAQRRAYVTGQTWSPDLPIVTGAADATLGGPADAFVGRLSADGDALGYSTFLGGERYDAGAGVAVDARGMAAYVTGQTLSADYPVSDGAFDAAFNGGRDAFVTKLELPFGRWGGSDSAETEDDVQHDS
jgi:hypothetical protein